jgi:hypothetical protein
MGTDNLEDRGIDASKLLKREMKKKNMRIWIGLNWLRLVLSGSKLLTSWETVSFSRKFFYQ